MNLNCLRNWQGAIDIDGVRYETTDDVSFSGVTNQSVIILFPKVANVDVAPQEDVQYRITVKQYMTRKATPEFTFMQDWNDNNPMPLRTMIGTIDKETRGMCYMTLHGDIIAPRMQYCLKCGKAITNPVSQYFGMGPECGGHNYVNPFESESELKQVVEQYRREYLQKITWSGWIIKSAIIEQEEIQ